MNGYSVSTDRQQQCANRFRGQSMIWDERRNQYVADSAGEVLTFPTPHDAERWIEDQWLAARGIAPLGARAPR